MFRRFDTNQTSVTKVEIGMRMECSLYVNLTVGDIVRISKYKNTFEKGYEANWSEELFKIYSVSKRTPVVYKLKDLNNEIIDGSFYENELQRVYIESDTMYKIDKIVDSKGSGHRKKLLVKWQ